MKSTIMLKKRLEIFGSVLALLAASVLPALFSTQIASAAQITSRSVRLTSSVVGQTGVTYNANFRVTQTTAIRGLVVEICQNSPLIGTTCDITRGVAATPTTGTITFTNAGSTGDATFEVHANSTATGRLILTDADGITGGDGIVPVTGADFTFSFTATNPTGTISTAGAPGTFYARVLTYGVAATAAAYTSTVPGTHLDDGGIALSTARQLTVNARVQEQLEFCVAAIAGTVVDASTTPANCTAFPTTTTVDIGVVDSAVASISPVAATSGGNATNGGVMIRTNAVNGATISYFAEQNGGSGRLKVAGATCSGTTGFDAGSSEVDQCFNASATQTSFAATGEKFGMTSSTVLRPTGSTTTNLTRDTSYDGDGTAAGGFAWNQTGTNDPATTLATSTTVMDYEMLVLRFAARAAATTPTGAYAVTSTYIATSTF